MHDHPEAASYMILSEQSLVSVINIQLFNHLRLSKPVAYGSLDQVSLVTYRQMQASTSTTLQQAQTAALLALLNLNAPSDPVQRPGTPSSKVTSALKVPAATGPPVWKVLVLDQQTKDVLATVLRVQDLRDVGVTLHV